MRRTPWTACFWPGLAQLWSHGSWWGLALAVGAATVLDVLLLATFGWSELTGQTTRNIAWAVFAVAWLAAACWSARQCCRENSLLAANPQGDAFTEAMQHYLKGDYYQAEQFLRRIIARNTRDVDARLMLATLLRHTGRPTEASEQLDTMARFDGADKWNFEIEEERRLLAEAEAPSANAA
ncbi:MAG: tetratricopeptide repeat protein [Planctomycetaceae bacterium]|nr:tetratricopeptide repeat protein [Planctomycetaceae bacterium]